MTYQMSPKWLGEWRKIVLLCSILVLLAGAGIATMLLPEASPVSKANYNRIRKGMTKEEVTQILGFPSLHVTSTTGLVQEWEEAVVWKGGNSEITVLFTYPVSEPEKGHAILKCCAVGFPILDRLPDSLRIPIIRRLQYEEEYLE